MATNAEPQSSVLDRLAAREASRQAKKAFKLEELRYDPAKQPETVLEAQHGQTRKLP
jgi:hypothetical protein